METRCFASQADFPVPAGALFAWHERPGAVERLSPPWNPVTVIRRGDGIRSGEETLLRVRIGPLNLVWQARHEDYERNRRFRDRQVRGPFKSWVHTHEFIALGEHRARLRDRVDYALPGPAPVSRLATNWVESELNRVFRYRHQVLAADLDLIARYPARPLQIVVAGAGGVLGSALIPFLSCAGHRVLRLVRRPVCAPGEEAFWDPDSGRLNPDLLEGADAVIHLCGENIGRGRWTAAKKRRIVASRVQSTRLMAAAISRLQAPPPVLIIASAIGFYGNRGDQLLTEDSASGRDFVSAVCRHWEQAAAAAGGRTRVVQLRIGVVLTPRGGALAELLPVYRLGLGGPIGDGRQYLSWVHIDDFIGALYHCLFTPELRGPVNVCAPASCRQHDWAASLAAVLERPASLRLPSAFIRLLFGQKGVETLLSSTRVFPAKLLQSSYHFRYPELRSALEHLLGRP